MDEVNDLIKQVEALFNKEQYKEIIDLLSDAVLSNYNSSDLYAWRAWVHNRLEETDLAFEFAEKAIVADPNNSFGYQQRGNAWSEKTEYDKAILDYNKAIELKKDDAGSYNNRGVIWKKKILYDKAMADFNKAIELDNNKTIAYLNRGTIYSALGEFDKAIYDYDFAIRLKPEYSVAYNNRGASFASKREFAKAIADYDKAIELKPYSANTFRNRGMAFYALSDFQKAIEDFQKAIELDKIFSFLETKIKLAKEKLEERIILDESNAQPIDKDEKLKIEKEIELLINTIRDLSKSEVKTVVHYTKVFVADIYVKSIDSKMHYSNAIYMNDPMEGKILFDYLDDEKIKTAYLNGEKRTETSVYLGSFLPAEENDGEISHEDELVMWRTYGKDEKGKEAVGCSVVLSSNFFNMKTNKNDESQTINISEELLNVVYIKNLKRQKKVANDSNGKIESTIKSLKKQLKLIIKLRDKYQPKEDFYKDIENTIFKQLSTISYLFKSADYDFEHEVRVITYMPRDSDLIQYMEINEPNIPPKRFYIESHNDILPFVKKIFLGPKVENYQQWSLYFDYEIRQRAKELAKMSDPPYKINPSGIEIMKSECKFQ